MGDITVIYDCEFWSRSVSTITKHQQGTAIQLVHEGPEHIRSKATKGFRRKLAPRLPWKLSLAKFFWWMTLLMIWPMIGDSRVAWEKNDALESGNHDYFWMIHGFPCFLV